VYGHNDLGRYAPFRRISGEVFLTNDSKEVVFGSGHPGNRQQFAVAIDSLSSGSPTTLRQLVSIPGAEITGIVEVAAGFACVAKDHARGRVRLIHVRCPRRQPKDMTELADFDLSAEVSLSHSSYSPQTGYIATSVSPGHAPAEGLVTLTNVNTSVSHTISHRELRLTAGFWSPDGRRLSIRGDSVDGTSRLLVLDMGRHELIGGHGEYASDAALDIARWRSSGNISFLAYGNMDTAGVYELDVDSGKTICIWNSIHEVEAVYSDARIGNVLWWLENVGGCSRLFCADTNLASPIKTSDVGSFDWLPQGVISDFAVTPSHRWAVGKWRTPIHPATVAKLDFSRRQVIPIVDNSPSDPLAITREPSRVKIPLPDERSTECLLYQPDSQERFPLLVIFHGGPELQERPEYSYLGFCQWLASAGIGVLLPNISGSIGCGRANRLRVRHDWGGRDLEDVRAILQFLRAAPWVESSRLGVFGESYGGYLAAWALIKDPGLWRCAAAVSGIINLVPFTQAAPERFRRQVFPDESVNSVGRLSFLLERSPAALSDAIKDSILLVNGTRDSWAPVSEAARFIDRLQDNGVDARLHVLPGERHRLSGAAALQGLQVAGEFFMEKLSMRPTRTTMRSLAGYPA
jgi:dienelactone hydrolase